MVLAVGDVFAGYTVVRPLGSGGMGQVYLVEHPRLPRRDALKVLPPELSGNAEFRERFEREAALASALFHPNIVGVHDRGEFDGQLWIAMDYVDGTDVAALLRERYPAGMPIEDASAITTAVASALDYAHDQGLLHRDVKPANILLSQPDRDGQRRVFLADFGIARPMADPNGLTATNLTVGTVAYAAPEQLMGEQIDGRADEYALAATAFHLLTGVAPFENSNPVAVISQHLTAAPPSPGAHRADLVPLDPVFATALAKDPAQRFDSCGQFAAAVHAHAGASISAQPTQSGITVAAPLRLDPTTAPPQPSPPAPRRKGLRPALITAAALAAITAITAAIIAITHTHTHTKPHPVAGPTLDGTYRLVFDDAKRMHNGAPAPQQPSTPGNPDTANWAFRSLCTADGCVATATQLENMNASIALDPAVAIVVHFAGGQWRQDPTPQDHQQSDFDHCLGSGGKVGPGSDTSLVTRTLEPQPDGTLTGLQTTTWVTNACGFQGVVDQVPFVASRTGDVPVDITVADPSTVTASAPATSATPAPPGSPVLDGAYRVDYDDSRQTVNGSPITGGATETYWWAMRSACTSTRCTATGATLSDDNHQVPTGQGALVLQLTDGRWQDTPTITTNPCAFGASTRQVITRTFSLQPQPDGTLSGFASLKILDNGCGREGNVYQTPIVVTRIGDVPPTVVLADPTLFP